MAVTAGVTEEVVYRGVLIALGVEVFDLPALVAALLFLALFVGSHTYQGPAGMVRAGFLGLWFTGLTLLSGSILPAIVLHVVIDLIAFLVVPATLTARPAEAPEPVPTTEAANPGRTTEPSDPGRTTEPSDPGRATEPSDPGRATEPSDRGSRTEPSDCGSRTEPSEPGRTTEPTEPSRAGRPGWSRWSERPRPEARIPPPRNDQSGLDHRRNWASTSPSPSTRNLSNGTRP
jgi:hypothetical protein